MNNRRSMAAGVAAIALLAGTATGWSQDGSGARPPARVIASTSWTAAFARAAGAADVRVLAPYELRHPPEYEVKPSDLLAVRDAEIVIYAGYEVMAKRLVEAADGTQARLVRIDTRNDPATILASLAILGEVFGTSDSATAYARRVEEFFAAWREEVRRAGLARAPVVTHALQRPVAEALGFAVVGEFGPAALEAARIVALSRLSPLFVIDTWHNEVGGPLRETLKDVPYVSWLNFPVDPAKPDLLDVLAENRVRLAAAIKPP